jgi:hypothetical protein
MTEYCLLSEITCGETIELMLNASQTATWKFTPASNVRATFSTCDASQDQRTSLYFNGDQIIDQGAANKLDTSCGLGFQATRLMYANGNTSTIVAAFGSFDMFGKIRLQLACSPLLEIKCNETISGSIDGKGGTAFSFTAPQNVRFTVDTCTVDQNVSVVTG